MGDAKLEFLATARNSVNQSSDAQKNMRYAEADNDRHKDHYIFELIHDSLPYVRLPVR
jgi:hypothetical protein